MAELQFEFFFFLLFCFVLFSTLSKLSIHSIWNGKQYNFKYGDTKDLSFKQTFFKELKYVSYLASEEDVVV